MPRVCQSRVETVVETPRFMSEDEEAPRRPKVSVPVQPAASVPVSEPDYAPKVEMAAEPEPVAVAVAEAAPQTDIFGQTHEEEPSENLDIPAFMRRGGL